MVVHVEHFKPKWLSQPLTASPFSIHVIAVLGKKIHPGDKDFMGQTYMLKETCWHINSINGISQEESFMISPKKILIIISQGRHPTAWQQVHWVFMALDGLHVVQIQPSRCKVCIAKHSRGFPLSSKHFHKLECCSVLLPAYFFVHAPICLKIIENKYQCLNVWNPYVFLVGPQQEPLSFHAFDGMSVHIRSSTAKRSTYDGTLRIVTPHEWVHFGQWKNQLPNIKLWWINSYSVPNMQNYNSLCALGAPNALRRKHRLSTAFSDSAMSTAHPTKGLKLL